MNQQGSINQISEAIRRVTGPGRFGLHEPEIGSAERAMVMRSLDSGFVSSIGQEIGKFENQLADYTGAKNVVAVVNGTVALQLAMLAHGVGPGDEVLVPALTFVATANAVLHCGATPHFIESHGDYMGIDCGQLVNYLHFNTVQHDGGCYNRNTGARIAAIIPVHIFGMIDDIEAIVEIAAEFGIVVIEDAAEALGSWKHNRHAGLFGSCGALSFNGNKIITTGGGGAVLTDDDVLATHLRHISTTAKIAHPFLYRHDRLGFNFRMPNINAALGCAQMDRFESIRCRKKMLHRAYASSFMDKTEFKVITVEGVDDWNCWLNGIVLNETLASTRDEIIEALNSEGLECRPLWDLMHDQDHLSECPRMPLKNAEKWVKAVINIPSSAFIHIQ